MRIGNIIRVSSGCCPQMAFDDVWMSLCRLNEVSDEGWRYTATSLIPQINQNDSLNYYQTVRH